MSQEHSRSRTDLDRNYQGGLRSRKSPAKKSSFLGYFLKSLRFIVLWGGLATLGYLYYQERLWSNALEHQSEGYMTLISNLVADSTVLKRSQKRELIDVLSTKKLRRCYLIRPIITINCVTSLSSP